MTHIQIPRILLVEDNLIIATDLAVQLKMIGCEVVGIHTCAEDALLNIEQIQPDILLTDIYLKGNMDGIALANHIKNTNKTPVLFISAHSNESMIRAMIQTEPYGFIPKPFTTMDLKKWIAFTLNQIAFRKNNLSQNHSVKKSNRSDNQPHHWDSLHEYV